MGARWLPNGYQESLEEAGGWEMADWEGRTRVSFDGWKCITRQLPGKYPSGYYTPALRDWRCLGDNRKALEMVYPVKISRLYVTMREKVVYLTDLVDAKSREVELKDLCVGSRIKEL